MFGCPSRIRTSPNGSKVRCPTTRRRGSEIVIVAQSLAASPGLKVICRAKKWSGRRDSNPRPSPWQGDALPTEPLPLDVATTRNGGAESQNRTGDTAIFSRVLYQLSYLGPMANRLAARRRAEDYHARLKPFKAKAMPLTSVGSALKSSPLLSNVHHAGAIHRDSRDLARHPAWCPSGRSQMWTWQAEREEFNWITPARCASERNCESG